ncbi:hypothetical protein F5Y14DRAFT_417231 [Nemania sp. NC0429]|nr:hypothetical protein F5Y14DRAFT_417231 [Nemania sp. NC0429]
MDTAPSSGMLDTMRLADLYRAVADRFEQWRKLGLLRPRMTTNVNEPPSSATLDTMSLADLHRAIADRFETWEGRFRPSVIANINEASSSGALNAMSLADLYRAIADHTEGWETLGLCYPIITTEMNEAPSLGTPNTLTSVGDLYRAVADRFSQWGKLFPRPDRNTNMTEILSQGAREILGLEGHWRKLADAFEHWEEWVLFHPSIAPELYKLDKITDSLDEVREDPKSAKEDLKSVEENLEPAEENLESVSKKQD